MIDTLKTTLVASPYFGICLSILAYQIGMLLHSKFKFTLFNPLLVACVLCCAFLLITRIPYSDYFRGGQYISFFMGPATCVLGVTMYNQIKILKANIWTVLISTFMGALVSIVSVVVMAKLFALDRAVLVSFLPKSVTAPISVELSRKYGGIPAVTVIAVLISGVSGTILAPFLIKIFRVKNRVAKGLALGTTSHALGTAYALEIGELEGAMSSLAIGCAGLATVLIEVICSVVGVI
jgi:predicted murein hydrolase (TIGR00659 family)